MREGSRKGVICVLLLRDMVQNPLRWTFRNLGLVVSSDSHFGFRLHPFVLPLKEIKREKNTQTTYTYIYIGHRD